MKDDIFNTTYKKAINYFNLNSKTGANVGFIIYLFKLNGPSLFPAMFPTW